MARIPTLEQPSIAPTGGAPQLRSVPIGGFDALTRGAQQFGQGVGNALENAAAEYDANAEKARQKALAADVTDSETELTKSRTQLLHGSEGSGKGEAFDAAEEAFTGVPQKSTGFLSRQGRDAAKASAETLEAIEKRRQELADELDEEARELFLKRTAGDVENDRRTVSAHVAQQRRAADVATLEARKEAALEAVRKNPNNLSEVQRQSLALEGSIRALGLSEEDKAADLRRWQGEVAVAQIAAQLRGGDWQSAETTLKNKRDVLGGGAGDKLEERINAVKADAGAEAAASSAAAGATDPHTGRINDGLALELLEKADLPPEARKKAADRLEHKLLVNERVWKEKVSGNYDSAFTVYLKKRTLDAVPPATREWLQDNAPAKWDELEQKQRRDREYQKKLLRGENNEGETPAERLALVELQSDLVRNPDKYANMSPAEFNLEWGARLSPSGYKVGGKAYADASKGDRLSDGEFSSYVNELARTNPHFLTTDAMSKQEKLRKKQLADAFRADFGEARRAFRDREKRNPTMTEVQEPEFQKLIWTNTLKRSGVRLEQQLPEMDFTTPAAPAKPSKAARARELKASGLSNADIAKRMNEEGY